MFTHINSDRRRTDLSFAQCVYTTGTLPARISRGLTEGSRLPVQFGDERILRRERSAHVMREELVPAAINNGGLCSREGWALVKYLDWSGFQLEAAALPLNFGLALLVNTRVYGARARARCTDRLSRGKDCHDYLSKTRDPDGWSRLLRGIACIAP